MAAPPRDGDGFVKPHDDPNSIPDDSHVVRFISPIHFIENKERPGSRRLASGAFVKSSKSYDRYEGISVQMYEKLMDHGVDPESLMQPEWEGAVILPVGQLRKLSLMVGPDPMQNNDPFHASIWGWEPKHKRKIKALSKWLIRPSDVVEGV